MVYKTFLSAFIFCNKRIFVVGSCFIRTDQLDGETDWKLRLAVLTTQGLTSDNVRYKTSV